MKVLVTHLSPTLSNPVYCSQPGSSAYEILQAKMLVWIIILFSGGSSLPGIKPVYPALQADSLSSEHQGSLLFDIYIVLNVFLIFSF